MGAGKEVGGMGYFLPSGGKLNTRGQKERAGAEGTPWAGSIGAVAGRLGVARRCAKVTRGHCGVGAARRRTEARAGRSRGTKKRRGEPGILEVSGATWGSLPPSSGTLPQSFPHPASEAY